MKRSERRILTTHTGSLSRSPEMQELLRLREGQDELDQATFDASTHQAVAEVVQRQIDTGLDVINDGEQGRAQYATYVKDRLTGFEGERLVRAWTRLEDVDFPEFAGEHSPLCTRQLHLLTQNLYLLLLIYISKPDIYISLARILRRALPEGDSLMRTATFILLSLAAIASWGCVQVEAKQNPALTEAPESLLRETTSNLPATPSPFPSATPTPTPFLTATPGPSHLRVEMLLPQINTAMGGIRSFQAEGNWNGEKSKFIAFDLQGDRLTGGSQASFLEQSTIQAALSGELALEDMSLEEVVSKDWKRAYRITGRTPNDSETDQVVFLVDPEQLLILELRGYTSSSGREMPGTLFDVRFSHFNEPVETPAPEFGAAPPSPILPGSGSLVTTTMIPTPTPTPRPTPTTGPSALTRETAIWRASRGLSLARQNLEGADLSNHSWGGINFAYANLRGADFTGAILSDSNLGHADLTGADLTGADLTGAITDWATFRDLSNLNWIDRQLVLTGELPPIRDEFFPLE